MNKKHLKLKHKSQLYTDRFRQSYENGANYTNYDCNR